MNKRLRMLTAAGLGCLTVWSCMKVATQEKPLIQIFAGADDANYAKQIESETPLKLADGLKINIWATDSLAPDPIAMSIDDYNRIYLTRTNRQKNSEFDIRGHRDWMTESISLQSVEDRRAFLRKIFAPEKSDDNSWLKDLNEDGSHDWRDLAVEQEEVWRLEDTDSDGLADVSTQVLKDFNEEITDVAGALLIRRNDAFIGLGPDLWRIEDTDGDGYYDKKTSIAHGFNIHIGFSGHGMSGLTEGPDGKIYWGIGDPGLSMTDQTGKKYHFPNQGVIVRCNPDGSDFEVFSHGHRNTHEFVFDEFGNLISSDNDGDHRGESERLVHIVEGSDSGWRINWQFGKYTDPKNNEYKIWMDEEMYKPRQEGQAAYFLPPIRNYHNGPTGMLYNPGTALGSNWLNKFFLVEFTGTPSRAHIWSFDLKQNGATFDFKSEVDMLNGVLATGIRFGTDGALYAADWVNGWGTKDYGRIWKIDVEDNDLAELRAQTKELMAADYTLKSSSELYDLLFFKDQRIRQKAQFELATRADGAGQFEKALSQTGHQLARVHGIWGIGQKAAKNPAEAEVLVSYLNDVDKEIVAQAAKILGDVRYAAAGDALTSLLNSTHARVRFYAAQALGRIEHKGAVNALISMIKENNDADLYIRHAGVLALSRIGEKEAVYSLVNSPSKALRTAAVLVLRKWHDAKLADFLKDKDMYVVAEAARAINDDWSVPEALPALANVLNNASVSSEVILRRAINAALRVGEEKQLNDLLAFAQRANVSEAMKAEAIATIGVWAEPSVLDRVDGRYRGPIKRDADAIRNTVIPKMASFLDDNNESVVKASIGLLKDLEIRGFNNKLAGLYERTKSSEIKTAVLEGLAALDYPQIGKLVDDGLADKSRTVRTAALGLLSQVDVSAELLPGMVQNVMENGSLREKQQILQSLGKMSLSNTEGVFETLIGQLKDKKLDNELRLDLSEAIEASGSADLAAKLEEAVPKGNIFEEYADVLYGGNRREGYMYFTRNETGQCIRCHAINGQGGTVGPDLSDIGNTLERKQILQALVEPSARLAPGYGTVTITLDDGQEVTGILEKEDDHEMILRTSEAEPLEVAKSRIKNRENYPSGMPMMGYLMNRREMRDVIEYLSNLKKR
ncbi:DUF7133 domain-containing protein [Jiulongibacter sp. NS-SX5]|uniref:DUF7133 domain-containing protein n=1 Tax=Jiulongibacter sp. NS-SX5 TaxID=3463854 RepID=UPI0040586FA7